MSGNSLNTLRQPVLRRIRRWTLSALKIRHDALLDTLEQALTHDSDGLLIRLMDIHEVGREIRRQLERNSTPAVWQPHLPEDARPAGWRQGGDTSVFHAPSLNLQLFTTQPENTRQPDSGR